MAAEGVEARIQELKVKIGKVLLGKCRTSMKTT
jgi:hypothetical protein